MATMSFTALRRLAGIVFTLVLFSLCLPGAAIGQGTPAVTASAPAGLNHPTGWKNIVQTAIDSNGDWLVEEYPDGGLFEFPANGGPMITLVPLTGLGSTGGYQNPMVLLDPSNNLYVGGNWNNCMLEFNYNAATNSWPGLSVLTASNPSPNECGTTPPTLAQYSIFGGAGFPAGTYYFQPWGVAIGINNNIIVGSQNSGNYIFSMSVTGAWSNPSVVKSGSSTAGIIASMVKRPVSIAVDPEGNIYFVEDSGGLPGVYQIPASVVAGGQAAALASDCPVVPSGAKSPSGSSCLTRVDPNLPDVTAVVTDAAGNLYISDGDNGVFMIPNPSGTPNPSAAVMLSPLPTQGEVSIDAARKILYVPTTQTQANGQGDIAKVGVGFAEFGSSNVGKATATAQPIVFSFNSSVTPASFAIVEEGMTTPEFAITGGTCTTGTAYAALASCNQTVTFTPAAVGSASAKLLMLDAKNNILASIVLHGTGMGANAQVSPALESSIGSTLKKPAQVATDTMDNTYVADPGLGKVLMYAAGSSASSTPVSIGTGLTSPTGVAVDGAGDVFIADSGSGNVYEVPFGLKGLSASGQVTLLSGLGTSGLNLAVDGAGNLYVADPTNGRVVRLSGIGASSAGALSESQSALTSGLIAPSAVAVDSSNNLYVVDGANLYEYMGGVGAPVTVLNTLSGATGLAVDPSGAVYISSTSGTLRVPYLGGALVPASETTIAPDVTNSSSVALDRWGNMYVTPSAGPHITLVSIAGTITLPTPTSLSGTGSSTTAPATVTNAGNAPLLVSGYTNSTVSNSSLTVANFTGADGTCVANSTSPATGIAPGATCQVVVTFQPGPGQQGALTGWVDATSNAFNAPITINTAGKGLAEGGSTTTVTVGSTAQVVNTPVSVTVAASSGSGTPTGTVQVTYTSWTVSVPNCASPPCAPAINPATVTASSALKNGAASFTLAPVLAGSQTFTVNYSGDRVYGESTGSQTATVAKSSIVGFIPDSKPPAFLPFVLQSSGSTPYDGSQQYWQYNMPVTVNTAAGIPTGTLTFMDNSSTCPSGTSATGQGTAICALSGTSGQACPQTGTTVGGSSGSQFVQNSGTPSATAGASATFITSCLQMPNFVTYTPVISTHYITPVYSGDANFIGATDPTSTLFQVLRSALVNITTTMPSIPSSGPVYGPISTPSVTVTHGSTANVTLYLAPLLGYGFQGKGSELNNYNFPVTLACGNLPPHTECTFAYPSNLSSYQPTAPNSVQICPQPTLNSNSGTAQAFELLAEGGGCNASGVGVVVMTINTNVSAGTTTSQIATAASVTLASIFGLGMIGLFLRRKEFEKWRRRMMVLLMIVGGALSVTLTACNTTNLATETQLASPAGSYAVTITATQVGTQCVPQAGTSPNPCTTPTGGSGDLVYGSNNQVSLPYYINLTVQ